MAVYLRPKRAKKATATSQAIVLKRGEIFFEVPTGGVGTGIGKIKMGDGTTTYSSLPYFTSTEDDKVAFTNVTATTASSNNATYLTDFSPTATLKTNFNKIKQLLFNLNGQVSSINTTISNFQSGVSTIVAAINSKAGSSHASTDAPSSIAATVNNLNLGITPSGTLEKNANGTYDCTNYASFKVNVPASAVVSGNKAITANGTNIDVTSYKTVSVAVPASAVVSGTKSITANGNNQDVTSYKYVNVNVPVPSGYKQWGTCTISPNGGHVNSVTLYNAGFNGASYIAIISASNIYCSSPPKENLNTISITNLGSGNIKLESNGLYFSSNFGCSLTFLYVK